METCFKNHKLVRPGLEAAVCLARNLRIIAHKESVPFAHNPGQDLSPRIRGPGNRYISHLESVHLSAAHVVVHSASEDVHSVMDHSRRVEQPTRGQLRVGRRHHSRPRLSIQVETETTPSEYS